MIDQRSWGGLEPTVNLRLTWHDRPSAKMAFLLVQLPL
jgi:hypothetical protein